MTAAISPFKSQRAAQIAMTRADKAYVAALAARAAARTAHGEPTPEERRDLDDEGRRVAAMREGSPEQDEAQRALWDRWNAISDRPRREAERLVDEAHAVGRGVRAVAESQGFWVRSYHFGPNATRDLIAQNID